jgi:hypothetical protein
MIIPRNVEEKSVRGKYYSRKGVVVMMWRVVLGWMIDKLDSIGQNGGLFGLIRVRRREICAEKGIVRKSY